RVGGDRIRGPVDVGGGEAPDGLSRAGRRRRGDLRRGLGRWVLVRGLGDGELRALAGGRLRSAASGDQDRDCEERRRPPHSPSGCLAMNPSELRTSGCQPMPLEPSPGPAAPYVSQRSPATYMKTWSGLA